MVEKFVKTSISKCEKILSSSLEFNSPNIKKLKVYFILKILLKKIWTIVVMHTEGGNVLNYSKDNYLNEK